MYKVYAEKYSGASVLIYMNGNLSDDTKALSPKLTLTENNAGEFSIKLPSTNAGYDFVERLNTIIIVKKDEEEIWRGRIISMKEDFQKNKTITCEGEFAYLNDTIQPQEEYLNRSLNYILTSIINHHNTKDSGYGGHKQFSLGYITATDMFRTIDTYTNYESTLKVLNDKFIEPYGGIFRLRRSNNTRYLDYISESLRPVSSQVIEFGSNLLDFTKSYDGTDFCTVIIPLGARVNDEYAIESGDIDKIQAYTTIESVNSGSPYLANGEAINNFGWIEKAVHFDDVEDPEELLEKAQEYLKDVVFENLVLEVNAVDLGYLGADYQNINLSEKVRVISKPHNLDSFFPVKKITIPLDNPANTSFTMGDTVKTTLSAKTATDNVSLNDKINGLPTETHTLALARKNASDLIDSFTTGYITIIRNNNGSQELYVTDAQIKDTYEQGEDSAEWIASRCDRYWRWNLEGLAYYNKSRKTPLNPKGIGTAITMDGAIVADYLTVGTIRGGKIMEDNLPASYWNLNTGEFRISSDTTIIGSDNKTSTINKMQIDINANGIAISKEVGDRKTAITLTEQGIDGKFSDLDTDLRSGGKYYNIYNSDFKFTAQDFTRNFNKSVYGSETVPGEYARFGNLKAVFDYQAKETAEGEQRNFNAKLYGYNMTDEELKKNGIKDDETAIITRIKDESASGTIDRIKKDIYGDGGDHENPIKESIYYEYIRAINGLSSEFTKDIYGEGGTASDPVKTSLASRIFQNEHEIELKVSKTDLASEVSSQIDVKLEGIEIKAATFTVESGNFTIEHSGRVVAGKNNFIIESDGTVKSIGMKMSNGSVECVNEDGDGVWSWLRIHETYLDCCAYSNNPGSIPNAVNYCRLNFANKINGTYGNLQLFARNVVFSSDGILVTEGKGNTTVMTGATGFYGVTGADGKKYNLHFIHGIFIESKAV